MKGVTMKNKNWFWGLFFLLSAVFVVFGQTWLHHKIGITSILATVFLVLIAIESISSLEYFGFFISLSILYIIYSKPLNLMYISPWLLISSAILISISFSLLFTKRNKKTIYSYDIANQISKISENGDDNNPYVKVALNSTSKYIHSEDLQSGHFINYLGVLDVYFDDVQLRTDGAKLYIDCVLGSTNLYIPRNCKVVDNINTYVGDVKNHTERTKLSEDVSCITLTGRAVLSDVNIFYV